MPIRCYFGHHKCATTWISKIIYDICAITGQRPLQKQSSVIDSIREVVNPQKVDFYICQSSIYERITQIEGYRGFHVIRDPRDIIVSGYFSHLYSHPSTHWPALRKHRKALQQLSKDEGLLKEIHFSSNLIHHMQDWNYEDPNILELKMEDLTQNPVEEFKKILAFLNLYQASRKPGLFTYKSIELFNRITRKLKVNAKIDIKLNHTIIADIVNKNSFEKMSGGRKVSEEDIRSHYRKGLAGDWKNHFKAVHLELFYEKFPNLIKKLGYEIN